MGEGQTGNLRMGFAEGLERISRPADSLRQPRNHLTADNSRVQSRVYKATVLWRTFKWEIPVENLARCLNLKYVYAEENAGSLPHQLAATAAPSVEALSRLPKSLVQDLRAAAFGANLKSLLTLIDQAETHDAQAAAGLREMAARYDYEAILEVLPGAST